MTEWQDISIESYSVEIDEDGFVYSHRSKISVMQIQVATRADREFAASYVIPPPPNQEGKSA